MTYEVYLEKGKNSIGNNIKTDFLESGIGKYKIEKYYDAIRDLNIAVQKKNNVGQSYYYIGMSYHFLGKDNQACLFLQKAKSNNYNYDFVDFCN